MKKTLSILICIFCFFRLFSQYEIENSWDTINFESEYSFLSLGISNENIWQIGKPAKIYFDSAWSIENAIITDTLNSYPKNNYSYFDIKIGSFNYDFQYPGNIFIGFEHKYETDRLKDGGYITVSYDYGVTWMNIINDSFYNPPNPGTENLNLYSKGDTLFNGENGFSGNSENWVSTWFGWFEPPAKKYYEDEFIDTMILRFNFISDNIDNGKEGWMIDNIRLYSVFLSSVPEFDKNNSARIFPNPAKSGTNIEFNKQYKEINLYLIDNTGKIVFNELYYNEKTIQIDTKDLDSGVFFIKIIFDKELYIIKKLVIN